MDQIEAIQLLGFSAHLDHLYYSETAYRVAMDCLITNVNPKQAKIDRLLDPKSVPKQLRERDVKLWPGDPAESRARLQAIVDRELSRLRALEQTLRTQYEEPARAQAKDMALAALVPEELPLLRAMRMHEQSYDRALAAYRKARKENAALPLTATGAMVGELDETTSHAPAAAPAAGGIRASEMGPGEDQETADVGATLDARRVWDPLNHLARIREGVIDLDSA